MSLLPNKLLVSLALSGLLFGAAARGLAGDVSDDPRLHPVRARIQQSLEQTRREGLPSELLDSKVREGLAKGASPEAIANAVERLSSNLTEAEKFLRQNRSSGHSTALLRALAEARAAGADMNGAAALVHARRPEPQALRAVAILTDLSRRGYPPAASAQLVGEVSERDPGALTRLPAGLESVRSARGLSRADAVDFVRAGVAGGAANLDAALNWTHPGDSHHDHGNHLGAAKKDKSKK